jgi:CheY-like chemotaxis protein
MRVAIDTAGGIALVGAEPSGLQALKLTRAIKPNVAVLDASLPDMDGFALAQRLCREVPSTNIVVSAAGEERTYVQRAFEAGATGYVVKRSPIDYLFHAIRAAAMGGVYIDPMIVGRLWPQAIATRLGWAVAKGLAMTIGRCPDEDHSDPTWSIFRGPPRATSRSRPCAKRERLRPRNDGPTRCSRKDSCGDEDYPEAPQEQGHR